MGHTKSYNIFFSSFFQIEFDQLQDDGRVKDTDVIFLTAYIYGDDVDESTVTWETVGTEQGNVNIILLFIYLFLKLWVTCIEF